MRNRKLYLYTFLTGLGFIAVVIVSLFVFRQLRIMNREHNNFIRQSYQKYVEHLNQNTLGKMAEYIAQQYPFLKDTGRLKREAGSDWFWAASAELTKIARTFGFAYIYYLEKDSAGEYVFLMSSDIGKNKHPEWLGTRVWPDGHPLYMDTAYEQRILTFSPEPVVNEWGHLISAVIPIINDNNTVAGILGVDYDVSFMKSLTLHELSVIEQENRLRRNMLIAMIVSLAIIFSIMCGQTILGYRSVIVPIRLLEADERTRIMMDTMPLSCSLWNKDGRLLYNNNEACKLFGFNHHPHHLDDFLNMCLEPKQPDNVPDVSGGRAFTIKADLEAGRRCFEWAFRNAGGEEFPVEANFVRIPWEDTYRLALYCRDLREIKTREEAEREVNERMRIMVDEMAFSCVFFDERGEVIDCNKRTISLYRSRDKQEFINNFYSFSPECQSDGSFSKDKAREHILKAFREGRDEFFWEHRRGDGTPMPAEITLIRVKWKDRYRVVAYARDLSELAETKDNLMRILSITERSPNIALYINEQGNIEYLNQAVSDISGQAKKELLLRGLELLFVGGDLERLREYLTGALHGRNASFEMNISAKNGGRREFFLSAFSANLYNGKRGAGILGRDISELKQIQRELVLAKEQAERALEQEEYYNKAKSDFLSRISHEMRTPMNAIIGMADIARKSLEEAERERCLEKIQEASEHLLGVVNDMLDITGYDTGEFDWTVQPFSFHEAMRQITGNAGAKAAEKQQKFISYIDGGIPDAVKSDERRVKQILLNLLSNAVKFTPEFGSIGFSASTAELSANECRVRFEITDTGIGMDSETMRRLWEAFEQADSGAARRHGGIGLGLALTKRIIDMMKGSIHVESNPGKGSMFVCQLPLGLAGSSGTAVNPDTGKAQDISGVSSRSPKPENGGTNFTGRRILVVDDVEINRDIVFALLERTGAALDGAQDGSEAVTMFNQNKYDMVLMDLHMPVMDGIEAARTIRASSQSWAKTTPIISISADTGKEIRARAAEAGINDFLDKPVDPSRLYTMITNWLT
jgi:PAS domain S-box-containing protein